MQTQATQAAFSVHALAPIDYAMLVLYFSVNIGIGVWSSRKRLSSSRSFFLGAKPVFWWVTAVSYFATGVSSISFMGIPAKTFAGDWMTFGSGPAQTLAGMCTGIFFVGILRKLDMTTVFDYLERRFDRRVRLLGAFLAILLKVGGRMSIILLLPALAVATVTGFNVYASILVMGIVTTVYAMEGGFEAVVWTDLMQAVVMVTGAAIAILFVASHVGGGLPAMLHEASQAGKFHMLSFEPSVSKPTFWVYLGMFIATIFIQVSDQPLMQRMFAAKDERTARLTVVTGNALVLTAGSIFFVVGTALWVFYRHHPERLAGAASGDKIFPYFIVNELPPGLVGIIIASLCASAMGALSSALNATAAIVVTDFLPAEEANAEQRRRLRIARLSTLAGGIAATCTALFIAWKDVASLWDQFLKFQALIGGSIPGVFALGLLSRRANARGVFAGVVASTLVTGWVQFETDTSVFFHGFVAIATCMAVGYLASILSGGPESSKNQDGLTVWTRRRAQG
jgi:SSS family transporter